MASTDTAPDNAGTGNPATGNPGIGNPALGNASTGDHPHPRQNFGADAPPAPADAGHNEVTEGGIDAAFIADRQTFWSRFTQFTVGAVVAIVLLLIAMAVFLR